jgi:hypothetical protein
MTIFADGANRKPHCGAELFEMFANLMHCDATLLRGVLAQLQSCVDFFAKDTLKAIRQ